MHGRRDRDGDMPTAHCSRVVLAGQLGTTCEPVGDADSQLPPRPAGSESAFYRPLAGVKIQEALNPIGLCQRLISRWFLIPLHTATVSNK